MTPEQLFCCGGGQRKCWVHVGAQVDTLLASSLVAPRLGGSYSGTWRQNIMARFQFGVQSARCMIQGRLGFKRPSAFSRNLGCYFGSCWSFLAFEDTHFPQQGHASIRVVLRAIRPHAIQVKRGQAESWVGRVGLGVGEGQYYWQGSLRIPKG